MIIACVDEDSFINCETNEKIKFRICFVLWVHKKDIEFEKETKNEGSNVQK